MEDAIIGLFWGFLFGVAAVLMLQAYGRRKVGKALAVMAPAVPAQQEPTQAQISYDLESRIAVLEQIVTDPRRRLTDEIERLR